MRIDNFVGSNEFSVYLLDGFSLAIGRLCERGFPKKLRRTFFKRTLPLHLSFFVEEEIRWLHFHCFAMFVGAFNKIVKVVHFLNLSFPDETNRQASLLYPRISTISLSLESIILYFAFLKRRDLCDECKL